MPAISEDDARRILAGRTVPEIAQMLERFAEADQLLTSCEVIKAHVGRWVAAFEGRIVANARDLDELFDKLKSASIPANQAAIRFIEKDKNGIR